jgi:hypothetical protein
LEAVAPAERMLVRQDGPTFLVGHSFSGMLVTDAGVHPNGSALAGSASSKRAYINIALANKGPDLMSWSRSVTGRKALTTAVSRALLNGCWTAVCWHAPDNW